MNAAYGIPPELQAFFESARCGVTEEDIRRNVPSDPSYVRLWEEIRHTGGIPDRPLSDFTEVIGLTGFSDLSKSHDPDSLKAFRNFTSAAAVIGVHLGWTDGILGPPPNYLAANLLGDACREDVLHLEMLRKVFATLVPGLKMDTSCTDWPFLILGEMLLTQWLGNFPASARAAARLIKEERFIRRCRPQWLVQHAGFLLGLTDFSQMHQQWLRLAESLTNPDNDPQVGDVIQLLNNLRPEYCATGSWRRKIPKWADPLHAQPEARPRLLHPQIAPQSPTPPPEHETARLLKLLLDFTRSGITREDIERNTEGPGPGDESERRVWMRIWRTGKIPSSVWDELISALPVQPGPESGRYFRQFAAAVALHCLHPPWLGSAPGLDPRHPALCLLRDTAQDDRRMIGLLRKVFAVTASILESSAAPDSQIARRLFLLGGMLLAQWDHDLRTATHFAPWLLEAAEAVRQDNNLQQWAESGRCLMGVTAAEADYQEWLTVARKLENPLDDTATAKLLSLLEKIHP